MICERNGEMRVIAGKARRIQLKTPTGMETRPTTDRIKETLFNMIQSQLYDCSFLDLFSGSGGIGIEALSRGAEHAVFIDSGVEAIRCIKDNLKNTHLEEEATVIKGDVLAAIHQLDAKKESFDIIFMDPPYGCQWEKRVLELLKNTQILGKDTMIIVEASLDTDYSYVEDLGYEIHKVKTYKTNMHIFLYVK